MTQKNIYIKGLNKSFSSRKECFKALKLKENSVYVRMKRHNETFEEAVTFLVTHREKVFYIKSLNKTFKTEKECLEYTKITPATANKEKKLNNISFEEAIENILSRRQNKEIYIDSINQSFKNKSDCIEKLNINNRRMIYYYMNKGYSFEDAIKIYLMSRKEKIQKFKSDQLNGIIEHKKNREF